MGGALAVLLTTLLTVGAPIPLLAKGEICKITIKSADLAVPIEITDPKLIKDFTVYSGPGFRDANGQAQTEGFIIDWSRGAVAECPKGLQHYEVSFYQLTVGLVSTKELRQIRLVYVVSYDYDPSSERGYIYVPGRGDQWYELNILTVSRRVENFPFKPGLFRKFEGSWFHARPLWEQVARPLIAGARKEMERTAVPST